MKKANRILSMLLAAALLVSVLAVGAPMQASAAGTFASVGGWNETIYAKISGISDSQVTGVSWAGTTSGSLTGQDLEYLVRDEGGYTRIDVLGLKPGTYTLTVNTTSGTLTKSGIVVEAQDRSGFAHFNYTQGVGAYNDNGTLKDNAIVLYVTDSNKNSVTVTSKDGTTVTGIGNILGSTGMDVGTGLNAKGGKANTNQDILRKLAADGTPLVVRLIGNVTAPEGLTAYDSIDYGGTEGDNGYMARMSGGKDITIEGVGSEAAMNGWGIHFICQTDDYALGYGKSFEVRNITFKNVPEDCVGMEGQQVDSTLTAPVERCWVHHCTFIGPTISNPAESDKDGGDGACDFKRGQYFTNSYCVYEGYHKTNLVGSSDTSLQYHLTYHHNYWKNCESRGPLARQADIHMYNNIFEGQTSYAMNPRADAYIFSEYNMFLNSKNPVQVKAGAVKSYNDSFVSCTGDNDATVVTDKSTKVSTNCLYANFDTNSSVSYIPSGDYELQESITEMKKVILAESGAQPATVVSAEDVDVSVIPADRKPTAAVVLPYDHDLNKTYVTATSGTYDNVLFNVGKVANDSITVGGKAEGCDIVFYVNTTVNISMTEISGTYSPVLCNEAGEAFITGTGSAEGLPAGYYFIQSTYDPGSSKYKEAKISHLTIEAAMVHGDNDHVYTGVVTAPTCTKGGYTTYTCECGASYVGNETAAAGHKPGAAATCTAAQTCTVCGDVITAAIGHSYVNGYCSICGLINPSACDHTDCSSVVTAPTCTKGGYTTYTCNTCGYVYTGNETAAAGHTPGAAATCTEAQTCTVCGATVTAALGHNYVNGVCSRCGAQDLAASGYIHNMTTDGTSSEFYTIAGSTSTSKGDVSYDGLTLSTCLKVSSSASVTFTAPYDGTFTMVFNPSCSGYTIYINGGNSTAIPSDGIITLNVTAGTTYKITKNKSESFLYYLVYAPASSGGDTHTHSYTAVVTAPTCTAKGYTTYTCSCGDSYVADEVAATGHSYSNSVTTQPGCETAGVRTYTCANCGDSYTESIPATGHSYSGVVTAPTCETAGYTTYTCSKCGSSYVGNEVAATGHSYKAVVTAPTCTVNGYTTYTCSVCGDSYVGNEVAATGHSYVNGTCTVCGASDPSFVELFDLYGSNVNLGNDLTMNFYVSVNNINGEAYYIEIVKEYDDGSTVTTTVPYADWESYYGVMWKVSLEGMAAKEMADKIYVTVYTTAGVQVSNTWTDSIRDYCIRQLNNASQSGAYTLLADMLNYGAAAQTQFGYNVDDLANSTMTAAQKAYATQSFNLSDYENNQVKGTNYIGSSLSLETNIQLTIYFNKLSSSNGLKAVVSYTDHLGEAKSYEVAEADFTTLAGIYYGIVVDTLVAADVCQVVSVALYDGSTLVGYASDSMESYAVRQGGDMNIALMKFTLSAYEFLH